MSGSCDKTSRHDGQICPTAKPGMPHQPGLLAGDGKASGSVSHTRPELAGGDHTPMKLDTTACKFWQSVKELADMRKQIPEERRAMSGARRTLRNDTPEDPAK
jgi:hypothetical protein